MSRRRKLLWGDLMVSLLLGVAARPNSREIERRARSATEDFLQLRALRAPTGNDDAPGAARQR